MSKTGIALWVVLFASIAVGRAFAGPDGNQIDHAPSGNERSVMSTDGHANVEMTGRDTPTTQSDGGQTSDGRAVIDIGMDRDNEAGNVDGRDVTIDRDSGDHDSGDHDGGDHDGGDH